MMSERLFLRNDLVCSTRVGAVKLAIVKQVGGCEDSDDSSDSDSDDTTEEVTKGYVRVEWVPSGKNDVVPEDSVKVVDRSFFPRDVVRSEDGQQLGTVLSTAVTSNVFVAGTRKVLKGVNVSDFRPFVPFDVDEIVAYGPWIGRVQDSKARVILKLSNGSRIAMDSEAFEECDSLVWPKVDADAEEPYPGQMLSARGKFFKDVEWISGDKINFRMKNWYKMVVEQIEIVSLQIKWGARAFTGNENDGDISEDIQAVDSKFNKESSVDVDEGSYVDAVSDIPETNLASPPPAIVDVHDLKKLRPLNHFWQGNVWVMDKFRYRINTFQAGKLNQQKIVTDKNTSKKRSKKRMQKILRDSTSEESILKSQKKRSSSSEIDSSVEDMNSDRGGVSTDGDDEDSEYEDLHCDITPSSGAHISVETADDGIDILVNNDSDLKIASPIGQFPTILGTMSCRFAECELDFTLTQKGDVRGKKMLLCNIQYPGHSEEKIAEMGKQFQRFMKSALKKQVHLLSSLSTASLMAMCPQAVHLFVLQQPSIAVVDIYYEYTVDCQRTSGVIDKDGNKTEIEFEGDADDYSGLNQIVQMMNEMSSDDEELTHGNTFESPARQQTGRNVKFLDGQWITVEIRETSTSVKVQWQDGIIQNNIKAKDLFPAHHVDDNDFCPGDFVIDKRVNVDGAHNDRYGVVLKMDNKNRMAQVKWMKSRKPDIVEEVSSYEIADSEEMQYRISDIVARTGDSHQSQLKGEGVGELLCVNENGMLQVMWTDGTISLAHPLDVNNISRGEEENSIFASSDSEEDASWTTASSGELDSETDSEIIGDAQYANSVHSENNASDHERDRGEGATQQDTETSNETEDGSASLSNDDAQMAVSLFVEDIIEAMTYQLAKDELNDESTGHSDGQVTGEEPYADGEIYTTNDIKEKSEETASTGIQQENEGASTSIQQENESTRTFSIHTSAPATHHFAQRHFNVSSSKNFMKAFQRDLKLLRSSLPSGITVKTYEDRMDLLSILVEGPSRTPYENGLFAFHIHLSGSYPESPPSVHYISYSPRLNPNLYETGRVCVSLLGTWSGKGNEVWTKDSTILQVLLSIQGLILNSEPYYNEAGYEGHRGSAEGATNSRCYNEMVTLRLVQHMTSLIASPPEEFIVEVNEYCTKHIPLLIDRVKNMFHQSQGIDSSGLTEASPDTSFPLLPLSKGVTLSLQNRLTELESAFEAMKTE